MLQRTKSLLAGTAAIGLTVAGMASVGAPVAGASTPSARALANCALHHHGQLSWQGFPFPQDRWTETFSNNCAHVRVRAKVICQNNATGSNSTNYGATINGNGTSYYTCNAISHFEKGYGQY